MHGSDTDAEAVRIARLRLQAEDPTVPPAEIERRVRVADGLTAWVGEEFDAVVGNPPFLGQLRRRTSGQTEGRRHRLGAYTDTSAVFLHRSLELVRPGGVVALVQPLSVLAARDARSVRQAVAACGAVTAMWASPDPVFAGAAVRTCVPVVRVGATGGPGPDEWAPLVAPWFGIPAVRLDTTAGTMGDLAACTADFRDQYYGLVPYVADAPPGPDRVPLVTSGLIDPAHCRWGSTPTRFAKQRYAAPVVDLAGLRAAGDLAAWADARMVPKLLVAGQGRVIEAVADERGGWLPSVPVVSVVPRDPADLWRLLALTLAPPVVADAAARYLGTGLQPGSVKLSARQIAALPLPVDRDRWSEAAVIARQAQHAHGVGRPELLRDVGRLMMAAYGIDDARVLAWWWHRLGA